MTSACTCAHHGMHTSSHHHEHRQVITTGELIHRSHHQDRAIDVASASFVHRHRSFIHRDGIVTALRHRQVRRPASYHYRRPASSPSSPETGKLSLPETGIVHRQVKSYA